jgi:hypothetical protein
MRTALAKAPGTVKSSEAQEAREQKAKTEAKHKSSSSMNH